VEKNDTETNCILCLDGEQNAVFLDCGHGGILYRYIY